MNVLCLGFSSIVERRVLRALNRLDQVTIVELARRRSPPNIHAPKLGAFYSDFDQALAESSADLVYVSTVNSEHAQWVEAALNCGQHVVVDKPAVTRLADAERFAALALDRGLFVAEALVYPAHPKIVLMHRSFQEAGSTPTHAAAKFCMPHLPAGSFRYQEALGGGALLDIGPYAVSIGRVLFGMEPEGIPAVVDARRDGPGGVETAFSVLLRYPEGRSAAGQFGFGLEYTNSLSVIAPGASVSFESVFTTPPELRNRLRARAKSVERTLVAPAACPFVCFLAGVLEAIRIGRHAPYVETLLTDARNLQTLRVAGLGGTSA